MPAIQVPNPLPPAITLPREFIVYRGRCGAVAGPLAR
jgi:hypothetical protein